MEAQGTRVAVQKAPGGRAAKGNPAEAGRTGNLLQAGLWENILQTVTEMWRAIVQRLFAFF